MLQRAGNHSPVSIDHTSAPFVWQEGLFEYLSNDIQLGLEGKNISDFPVDYHGDADHKEELVWNRADEEVANRRFAACNHLSQAVHILCHGQPVVGGGSGVHKLLPGTVDQNNVPPGPRASIPGKLSKCCQIALCQIAGCGQNLSQIQIPSELGVHGAGQRLVVSIQSIELICLLLCDVSREPDHAEQKQRQDRGKRDQTEQDRKRVFTFVQNMRSSRGRYA